MDKKELYQRTFEISVAGLAEQGFQRAFDKLAHTCVYRDPATNRKCALGQVIPDELYDPIIESITPANTKSHDQARQAKIDLFKEILRVVGFDTTIKEDRIFLTELQNCHDDNSSPRMMQYGLEQLARCYSFQIPEVLHVEQR